MTPLGCNRPLLRGRDQEPIEQPYGIRDCVIRDPAGNLIRIQERR